jgi:SAM-dependent methyltransferase
MSDDARRSAPAALRNREPIYDILRSRLPDRGLVLEIASGTGEHIVFFASNSAPDLIYQPSDPGAGARASIDAWVRESQLANVRPAIALDAASAIWPVDRADAVLCINMIHIAPWEATLGLLAGAARVLPPGGMLYFYGPFCRGGQHTAPSNAAFDRDLRGRNPAWGIRNLETVADVAKACGFGPPMVLEMPVNNLSVIFRQVP